MFDSMSTVVSLLLLFLFAPVALAQDAAFARRLDIIYHKQDGYALTMDMVVPRENRNGAAIVLVMSGGWFSNHEFTGPHDEDQLPTAFKAQAAGLLKRGYTLFYVVHGTQPKFTIREIQHHISAAVRHIRGHASEYQIDAARIGIMGGSAGGHLSLMQGTKGEDRHEDPAGGVTESSKVQAVVAYFPPTDFVNYGSTGVFFDKVVRELMDGADPYLPALDYFEVDRATTHMTRVSDEKRLAEHYENIAPVYHVTPDDAPTLLLHGDADRLVPIQQSRLIAARFKQVGVPHKLFLKEGGDHGWQPTSDETQLIADWFDEHLAQ